MSKIKYKIAQNFKKTHVLFITISLLLSPGSFSNIEVSNQLKTEKNTGETFTLNLRGASLNGFIEWVAKQTGKSIIVDNNIRGSITVISSRQVTADEAYELFLSALAMNNLSAVEIDGYIKIVPLANAKSEAISFYDDQTFQGEVVTAIIDLNHSDPLMLSTLIKPLMPATTLIQPFIPSKCLIIAGSARSIAKVQKLISIFDQPEDARSLDIIEIIHASASSIADTIDSVIKSLSNKPQTDKSNNELELVVDKRSNSILLIGPEYLRLQARNLINKLDQPISGEGNTKVVYLHYIEAEEIKPILKSVGDSIIKNTKTEDTQQFSIESSETTNALVITGPTGLINNLNSVIKKLDIQRAQVLIEAVVVQVSGDANKDLGMLWGGSELYEQNRTGGIGVINVDSTNPSISSILSSSSIAASNSSGTLTNSAALAAGLMNSSGFTYGYLKNGDLIGALRAITTRNKSNIMSTPTIVALDNEEASLLVGQNVPFKTGSSTSAATTITNPFTTIKRQDIGITLKVTPRINHGDSITLEIEQSTENVSPAVVADASDLVTDKTEIKTSALIKDGQVLVLGGLIREDDVKSSSRVPILGDLPLIGNLFRSSSVDKTKNNLMVFIRPIILKDELQITGLTAQRYAFMREKQLQKSLSSFIKFPEEPLMPSLIEDLEKNQ